jgi:Formyl transferase
MKKRIGVLLSGRGSNFEALADSVAAGRIPNAEIAIVISNREGAPGLEKARQRGIPAQAIPSKGEEEANRDASGLRSTAMSSKETPSQKLIAASPAVLVGPIFAQSSFSSRSTKPCHCPQASLPVQLDFATVKIDAIDRPRSRPDLRYVI